MAETIYDLIIIGGGSAGLAAGIYAGRAKLKTLILDKANPGGQIANTADVVNYPAIRRISGPNLVKEMHKHALDFKVHFGTAHIERVELDGELKRLYAGGNFCGPFCHYRDRGRAAPHWFSRRTRVYRQRDCLLRHV